jgi:hypothetical protein
LRNAQDRNTIDLYRNNVVGSIIALQQDYGSDRTIACPALSIPAIQNMRDILDASLYVRKHFLKLCDPRLLIFKHPANIRHIEHPDRGLAR